MDTAEWILVIFLSTALLIFLILAIILTAKLIGITKEVKKIVLTGQDIADNIKDMSSIGGIIKTFANKFTRESKAKSKK